MKKIQKNIYLAMLFLSLHFFSNAVEKRDLLASSCNAEELGQMLIQNTSWVNFPAYGNRAEWNAIPGNYSRQFIAAGESGLHYTWQVIPAAAYLEYTRSGNRQVMEKIMSENTGTLKKLVLAELAEGNGRFTPKIIDGVWTLCEMTTWALSAHLSLQKSGLGLPDAEDPIIDLGVGNTASLLAWTHYFFHAEFDKVSPLISKRIRTEIYRQVLQPYYKRNDFWWMAFKNDAFVNNWNVWINYNVLNCVLLIETDEKLKTQAVYKTMQSVDKFINYYKKDGACEEGPAYWSSAGGMLYQYLDLLAAATQKKVCIYSQPLIKKIGQYICNAFISQPYYINFADASAKLNPDAGLIYRYGKATENTDMMGFGSFLAHEKKWESGLPETTLENTISNIFMAPAILQNPAKEPLERECWMPETEIAAARDKEGNSDGFYFAAKGGHNNESHNHNDVGSCIFYMDGKPVLIDIGAETYTRKTFSSERYTIWAMRSAYHNLPLINGIEQQYGAAFKANGTSFVTDAQKAVFTLDIAHAYPDSAGVVKWVRTYQLNRNQSFEIKDDYLLQKNNGNTYLHFMTVSKPELIKPGLLHLTGKDGSVQLAYDADKLELIIESITITDERLLQNWPADIYRLRFHVKGGKLKGKSVMTLTKN